MTRPIIALCSATAIAFDGDGVPDWLQLLPAGEIRTGDGRGPYRVGDAAALMSLSLPAGEKLVLDENHATDLAAPKGASAPARGWIVELQAREGGIWGRVEWTAEGRALIADRAYRGISPAIVHTKAGVVERILRASLVNTPNLIGLASLHAENHGETGMDWKKKLIELLGLDSGADDDAIVAALTEKLKSTGNGGGAVALQSIAKAAGLAESSTLDVVLAGVAALAESNDEGTITALQSELATVTTRLNAITDGQSRTAATSFVDAAITAQRVGVKPQRDRYIALHMKDPAGTEELINALPSLHGSRLLGNPPVGDQGGGALGDADEQVISLMGLNPEDYKKSLAAQAKAKETL